MATRFAGRIRDNAAAAFLRLLAADRSFGRSISYKSASGTTSVYAAVYGATFSGGVRGGVTGRRELRVDIPRQTGFPPTNFRAGDQLVIDGLNYQIDGIDAGGADIVDAPVFSFSVSHQTADLDTV